MAGFLDPVKGFGVTFGDDVQEDDDGGVPGVRPADGAALTTAGTC